MFLLPVLWVWLGGSGLVGVEGEGYYKIPIPSHPTNLLSSSVLLCRATKKTQPITGQNQLNTTSDLIPDSPFVSHPEAARVVQFPPNPRVGQSVYLYLDDIPNPTDCSWFRGKDQQKLIVTVYLPPLSGYVFGPAYTGRETPGPNCSLRIENLNQDDSGTYTVTKDGPSVHGTGNHTSGLLPKPNMSTVQLFRENMDLVHLKCETTVKFANISWLQNGKPLSSCPRIQLSNNKQTLTIQPVLRHDAGAYQCQISNPFSAQRSDTTTISVICEYPLPGVDRLFFVAPPEILEYCYHGMSDCAQGSKGGEKWDDDDQLLQAPQPLPKLCSTDGPDPPVIKMTAKSLTQPSNGRLSCKASSFPEAEYCWFHNGKEFSKNPEILLKDIQSGTYTCQATNPFTQRKENTTLQIE
uniref:Ig-like domain-containing protein n=1 Tax=Naja naja TaxID=35670 RepID=A0A8C6Y0H7_NAJNA